MSGDLAGGSVGTVQRLPSPAEEGGAEGVVRRVLAVGSWHRPLPSTPSRKG